MLWTVLKERMLRHPQKTLGENGAVVTYEEAVIYAEALAKRITYTCCAILCESELFAALSLLACLASRVTAVPLSYRYGTALLERIIDYIHPPAVISDISGTVEIVDTDTGEFEAPECSPALIMCTSGTTGAPKGAMLSEGNILSNLCDISEYFQLDCNDTVLISRPLYHCAVLTGEFLTSLFCGCNVRFYSEHFDPMKIADRIAENGASVFCGTPTTLSAVAKYINLDVCKTLKKIAVSGECMTETAAKQIQKGFGKCSIYHVYGLTEASPRVAFLPPELFTDHPLLVGRPLRSVDITIVDGNGRPVKPGAVGELTVRGPSVMLGYYRQSELSSRALRRGWLYTGDLARVNKDGLYEIKGRKDDMIIRCGMNIYPSEIENRLKKDSRVQEALVYGYSKNSRRDGIGLRIAGDFCSSDDVFDMCRKLLAPYEMPTKIQLLEKLPQSGSGKLIRR